MRHHNLLFQLALAICLLLPSARAQAAELEVQFGAFTIESLAEECVAEYKHLDRDVFIKQIKNSAEKTYYTVRTGPFDSIEQAESFIETLSPAPDDKPWIMLADSMQPAAKAKTSQNQRPGPEAIASAEPAPDFDSEKAEEATDNRKAEKTVAGSEQEAAEETQAAKNEAEEEKEGLWGTAGSGENDTGQKDEKSQENKKAVEEIVSGVSEEEDKEGVSEGPSSVKELQQEVKDLKDKVQTLMDAREVREELEATEEEEKKEEEDILSAAGRQYTLLQKGRLGVEYKLEYTYFDYDAIREQNIIEHNSKHTITNTFTLEYPLKNNLSLEAAVPFIYKYDETSTIEGRDTTDVSDFGDVDFALNYQPFKSGPRLPSIIFRSILTCPMGRDPYDINPDTELSTGSGGYSLEGSISVSKLVDPIMVFGSLGYTYNHEIDDLDYKIDASTTLERYERGDTVEFSMGIGYSLSYITSLTLGYSYAYTFEDERFFKEAESKTYETRTASSLNIGTSWRLSSKMRMNMSLGIGLAGDDYYTLSFRFPYEFEL